MKIFNLIITTKKKLMDEQIKCFNKGWDSSKKVEQDCTWSAINPVIHDLEKLRANTWDQDKITHIQEWLRNNFKVK